MRISLFFLQFFICFSRAYADVEQPPEVIKMLKSIERINHPANTCNLNLMVPTNILDQIQKVWKSTKFKNPKISIVEFPLSQMEKESDFITKQFSLTVVLPRNSDWTVDQVKKRIEAAGHLFKRCKIHLAKITLVEADFSKNWIDVDMLPRKDQKDGPFYEMASALPNSERPVLFYFGKTLKEKQTGYGSSDYYMKEGSPLRNTAAVSSEVLTPEYIKDRGASYVPEAHELGHVLGNWAASQAYGHVPDEQNIMSGFGAEFNEEQCEDFQYSDLLSPISK